MCPRRSPAPFAARTHQERYERLIQDHPPRRG